MPATLSEITAIYRGQRIRWGDTIVGEVEVANELNGRKLSAVKGSVEEEELEPGLTYRFYGQWESYKNRLTRQEEQQFAFRTFVRSQPFNRGGVVRYLQSAPNVGQATAEALWAKFQGDAVRILREQPEVASAAVGAWFNEERAREAALWLIGEAGMEACTIELIDLLGGRGLPRTTAKKAVQVWGNRAAKMIRGNPYLLMRFRGCGYLRTDALYLDLIAAGVPYGELREIRRNAGTIVRACAEIRDGKRFTADERIDLAAEPARNLKVIDAGRPDAQIVAMLRAIAAAKASGEDPVWNVQVVTAVNAKSKLSRKELNQILQRELNKSGEKAGGNPFLVRDKIVCLKNGFYPLAGKDGRNGDDEQKVFVANGELAEVVQAEEKRTIARLENPARVIVIPRGKAKAGEDGDDTASDEDKAGATTGCQWDLGYALSVHKAQGSEFPVTIVMVDDYPGARMICDRSWLYTAISRAKKLCLLIGKKSTADSFCKRVNIDKRKTFLVERIKEASAL